MEPAFRVIRRQVCAALCALLLGCTGEQDSGEPPRIDLEAPRDYAYVIGDRIEQTLSLHLRDGRHLDPTSLPVPGPLNEWLTLRDSRLEPDQGQAELQRVHLTYQVFKGVRTPESVTIPPLALRLQGGGATEEIRAPAWSFTLAPVIPPDVTDEQVELRDPAPPLPVDAAPLTRQLMGWLAAATLVALLIGLRAFLIRRKTRPFAEAAREVRQALKGKVDDAALRQAARALHRAFDHTFGQTLFAAEIERFCARHHAFAPQRERMERFFVWSRRLFFETDGAEGPMAPEARQSLLELVSRCEAAERKTL
jgi:mxaA protein